MKILKNLVVKTYKKILRGIYYVLRWINGRVSRHLYLKREKELNKPLVKLSIKDTKKISNSYAKFIDGLPDNAKIYIASQDISRKLGEVAFTVAMNRGLLKTEFTHPEIRALQKYYYDQMEPEDISKSLLVDMYAIKYKFLSLCEALAPAD